MKTSTTTSKLSSSKTFQTFTSIILFLAALLMITQGFYQTGTFERIGYIGFGLSLILAACNTGTAFKKEPSDSPKTELKP
jgi:hypothetical protein